MSAVVETFIVCDGCAENFGVDSRHRNAAAHRENAKFLGWTHSSGKDYCENCRQRMKKENQESAKRTPVKQKICSHPNIKKDGGGDYCELCGKRWSR